MKISTRCSPLRAKAGCTTAFRAPFTLSLIHISPGHHILVRNVGQPLQKALDFAVQRFELRIVFVDLPADLLHLGLSLIHI